MFKIIFLFIALNGSEYQKEYKYIDFWTMEKCQEFIDTPEWRLMVAQQFGAGNGIRLYSYVCTESKAL